MLTPTHALVRRPPRSYQSYYAAQGVTIDTPLADHQHATYVAELERAGLTIADVAPDEAFPDGVFIEDTMVARGSRALVTRMVDRREGEQQAVAAALEPTHSLVHLPPEARLEGGDVLQVEDTTYVGLSKRTNAAGVAALREFLKASGERVIPVPVTACLHLKSAATYLGDGCLLAAPDWIDLARVEVDCIVETAPGESKAANAIRIGRTLLSLDGYPGTALRLRAFTDERNIHVRLLEMSEFEKGDGSLTCLSILW
jgi:dimethylargininase